MQLKNIMLGIWAAAVLATVSGCASWHRDGDRTAGRVVDDRAITSRIEEGLSNEPVYKFNDVDVKTFNGVVQLSGFVNTDDQRQRAAQIAQRVDGVSQVVNSIALKPQLSPTGRTNGLAPIHDATVDNTRSNVTTNSNPTLR